MEKINIAELLKDCPKGMELDCAMFDDVTFVGVDTQREFPIEIKVGGNAYEQCIPYKGNEHLMGKTDACSDFYKNWE